MNTGFTELTNIKPYGYPTRSRPYDTATRNVYALFGDQPGKLVVGDPFFQNTKSYLWCVIAGSGGVDAINQADPILEHTSQHMTDPAKEPSAVFYAVTSSYNGDWNLSRNNVLRSILATPKYNLAIVWQNLGMWRVHQMALGEEVGVAHMHLLNNPSPEAAANPYDQDRALVVLGDPTLRLHILTPPSNVSATLSGGSVQLTWAAGETGLSYHIYRASSRSGPFNNTTRLTSSPISGTSFTDNNAPAGSKVYLVRGVKLVTAGSGTYNNLSQGAFSNTVN